MVSAGLSNTVTDAKKTAKATLLNPNAALRIKPATVNIGGVELEGPLREGPEKGTGLWLWM